MRRRGSVLMVLLFLLAAVSLLSSALFKLHLQSLQELGLRRERQQALQMARSGLNHAIHLLTYSPSWNAGLNTVVQGQGYELSFSSGNRCVNNLANPSAATGANFQGRDVPPLSADLVVTGRSGRSQVRLHALLQHGLQFQRSLGALGKVHIQDDCEVRGIASFANPADRGGGILSKYQMTGAGDYAIEHSGPGSFTVGPSALIEALPQDGGLQAISPSIHSAVPQAVRENSVDSPLPEFDIDELMAPHLSHPPPVSLSGGQMPTSYLQDERTVAGDLMVNGDLVFAADGALYVDGDLILNGGVIGEGAIYCRGQVTINGGSSSLITNQGSGAALFAGGDVTFQGQSAVGYLDALATGYPAIQTRWNAVRNQLTQIQTTLNGAPDPNINLAGAQTSAQSLWGLNWQMSKQELPAGHPAENSGVSLGQDWFNSIPSPNGTHADSGSVAMLPALIDEIRNSLGANYSTDARAQRIVHALEETHYFFRHNADTGSLNPGSSIVNNRLVGGAALITTWDDIDLEPSSWSYEHGVSAAGTWGTPDLGGMNRFFQSIRSFYDQHPMDFSWLGSSNFQGIVYTSGDVSISNRFEIHGLVLSGGQVTLSGGSKLVYNDEYVKQGGSSGPLRCVFVHEL